MTTNYQEETTQMRTIDLGEAQISLIDDHIVLFEASPDTVIDQQAAANFYDEIEKHVSGHYSLIIHRKNKYQLLRMEVFNVINTRQRLVGIAIVTPRTIAQKMADMEAPLSEKPFSTFSNIDDATAWLNTLEVN